MAVRLAPDRLITQRRQEEELKRNYLAKVEREHSDKLFAEWENLTYDKIVAKKKVAQVEAHLAKQRANVEERRDRLAKLLAEEQLEYEAALDAMVETQDQRRERLKAHAMDLREKRETLRRADAQARLDQAFRNDCHVLREAESQNVVLQVAEDRREQIKWNEIRKQQLQEDNRVFDEMWEQDRLKKIQRAQDDLERTRKMNEDLRKSLAIQKAAYEDAKRKEKAIQAEEDRIYKEQIVLAMQVEAQKERERRADRVALGVKTKKFNELIRQEKIEKMRKERQEDIDVLNDLLKNIKEDEEKELAQKRHDREEARRWMNAIREQMGQDAENQAELERLWQIETDKEWDKREAQWKANQEARDRLMKQVFEERGLQLQLKRQNVEDTKALQLEERRRILLEMEALTLLDNERQASQKANAIAQKAELEQQIAFKHAEREKARRDVDFERVASAIAEDEFRKKVEVQLAAVEAKRPRSFQKMKLHSHGQI